MKIALSSSSSSSSCSSSNSVPVLRHAATAFTPQSFSSTSFRNRNSNFIPVMAKSKKPSSSNTSSQGSYDPPPRITSNVKQNLQFLKIWKELQKRRSSTPKPATSYRRKKVEKENVPEDTQEIYRDPTFTLYHVDIIYSGETCADSWIEREVMCLREDGCPKVWVVTSDHKHQDAAHGAGAFVWSCKALVSEIKESQKEVDRMIQEQRSTSFQGKLLKHNLNSEVVDALKDLRNKLYENERKK
ncbi:hypothetical protein LINPERPRIM_LOCUS24791 [Linum perenne]